MKPSKIAIIGSHFAASAAALSVLEPGIHRAACATEDLAKELLKAAASFSEYIPEEPMPYRERSTRIDKPNGNQLHLSSFMTSRRQHKRRLSRYLRRSVPDKFARKRCRIKDSVIMHPDTKELVFKWQ